ncbi:hypothetical protein RD792_007435 [Penstemon davidsonii]|uniref:Uncharacterized protein n=1 Tax=Penstemon davidsonii TaxID=160366 RepID=A0ABR0D6K8_9LAMI|nr:hypothetical protein RD792_007435 [Penstemon davidsonii]
MKLLGLNNSGLRKFRFGKNGVDVELPKLNRRHIISGASSSPRLSIWQRKKEMGKEGLMVTKELKRLQSNPVRYEQFMKSQVSPLLKV